ncbi:hypothetical protein NN561_007016 [Cricetulus griseus]
MGGKKSGAEPPPQPTPTKHAPQNSYRASLVAISRALTAPSRVLPLFLEFMVGSGRSRPVLTHCVPLAWGFWYWPCWAPSSLPAALAPVSAALSASRPPSSCLLTQPAGMGRDWSPGLGGHPTSVCLASTRGD